MNSSGKAFTVLIGGVVIVTLLAFLALSGVAATFAWMAGGGYGSGPALCQNVTPGTSTATSGTTPTPGGNTSSCVPASQIGAQVVAWAQAMGPPRCTSILPVGGASATQIATSPGTRNLALLPHQPRPPSRRR
jgi:hypothetical protein